MCVCVRGCCIFDIYMGKSISSPAVVDWNILNLYIFQEVEKVADLTKYSMINYALQCHISISI